MTSRQTGAHASLTAGSGGSALQWEQCRLPSSPTQGSLALAQRPAASGAPSASRQTVQGAAGRTWGQPDPSLLLSGAGKWSGDDLRGVYKLPLRDLVLGQRVPERLPFSTAHFLIHSFTHSLTHSFPAMCLLPKRLSLPFVSKSPLL